MLPEQEQIVAELRRLATPPPDDDDSVLDIDPEPIVEAHVQAYVANDDNGEFTDVSSLKPGDFIVHRHEGMSETPP